MTEFPKEFYQFIELHQNDDTNALRLKKNKTCDFDLNFAIQQIESRRKAANKIPEWISYPILFPSSLSAEQCTSELSAKYKQSLIDGETFCDLTGGLGIDIYYLSHKAKRAVYVERFDEYCQIARHNFNLLSAPQIEVVCSDCREYLSNTRDRFDTLYIDPARRGKSNQRLFSLKECEPNVLEMLPVMLDKSKRVLLKASPMIDISQSLSDFPSHIQIEIHIISIKNECKELLFDLRAVAHPLPVQIHCINILSENERQCYSFAWENEKNANCPIVSSFPFSGYLFEPNASILKAGAFKSIAQSFGIDKLQINSHLYNCEHNISAFPGRVFAIDGIIEFSSKEIKSFATRYPQGNISVRNFPLSAEELRKKLKIKDGGNIYIFATTVASGKRILLITHREKTND